jgi:hypothetical protein
LPKIFSFSLLQALYIPVFCIIIIFSSNYSPQLRNFHFLAANNKIDTRVHHVLNLVSSNHPLLSRCQLPSSAMMGLRLRKPQNVSYRFRLLLSVGTFFVTVFLRSNNTHTHTC